LYTIFPYMLMPQKNVSRLIKMLITDLIIYDVSFKTNEIF